MKKLIEISFCTPPSRTQGREGQKILLSQKSTSEISPQKHKSIHYKKTFFKMKNNTLEKTQKSLLWFKNLINASGDYIFFNNSQLSVLST
jgi:hypothetical protein